MYLSLSTASIFSFQEADKVSFSNSAEGFFVDTVVLRLQKGRLLLLIT